MKKGMKKRLKTRFLLYIFTCDNCKREINFFSVNDKYLTPM